MDRTAAAILLLQGEAPDLRIYIVERSIKLRFFGGYQAFPGGVLDADDQGSLPACALRELFEETGVMLDSGMANADAPSLQAARQALLTEKDLRPWQELKKLARGDASLTPVCRIRTPPFAPRRYDTVFYLAHLPKGQEPSIVTGELTDGAFERPEDLLQEWLEGKCLVVPPALILLRLLANAKTKNDLPEFLRQAEATAQGYQQGKLHRVQFSPGVIMASIKTPTLPPATTTNCCIVGHKNLQIIDPASPYPEEQKRLAELLDELVAEGHKLQNILVTHHHPDHVGGVHALSQSHNLPVRGHPLTLERLQPGFQQGEPLEHGDSIDLGPAPDGSPNWQLTAHFTPGHDRGHLCFHENRYQALIAGDLLSTASTILIEPPEGHLRTYLQSLEAMLKVPMQTLYPAHGPAVPNGHKLVRHYLRHRQQRESALRAALQKSPASLQDLVPLVYTDVDPSVHPLAARSMQAGLEKLQEEGLARQQDGIWYPVADTVS